MLKSNKKLLFWVRGDVPYAALVVVPRVAEAVVARRLHAVVLRDQRLADGHRGARDRIALHVVHQGVGRVGVVVVLAGLVRVLPIEVHGAPHHAHRHQRRDRQARGQPLDAEHPFLLAPYLGATQASSPRTRAVSRQTIKTARILFPALL